MTIKIVTDSNCDLPHEVIQAYGITVIPLYINFQEKSYLDGIDISRKEFYEKLEEFPTPPTTSAPAIGTFVKAYQALHDAGATAILSIHISSALSGVHNVAVLASEAVENIMVKTFDSGQLTLGTGMVVEAAAKAAQEGKTLEEILAHIKDVASRTYTYASIDTLKFLRRSGRLTRLQANLGTLLQLKPILHMNAGVYGIDPIRTTKHSLEKMINVLNSLGTLESLSIVHTNVPEKAEQFARLVLDYFPKGKKGYTAEVTPVIGAHIGPGAVGFVAVTSKA